MKKELAIFEGTEIRRVYDEATETWWFSVVDIVRVLTQQADYKVAQNYWKVLKHRLNEEGSQLVTNCNQLKLEAADGKKYLTDVATAETLLRLVQSVPSRDVFASAVFFTTEGTKVRSEESRGFEPQIHADSHRFFTLSSTSNPPHSVPPRLCGESSPFSIFNSEFFTTKGMKSTKEDAVSRSASSILPSAFCLLPFSFPSLFSSTFEIPCSIFDIFPPRSPRLRVSSLSFETSFFESVTNCHRLKLLSTSAPARGGRIAKKARLELESKTGKPVVTGESYLPPNKTAKRIEKRAKTN